MNMTRRTLCLSALAALATPSASAAQSVSNAILIPGGPFIRGSDMAERETGYRLDEAAYGHTRTRQWGWYDREFPRAEVSLPGFRILTTPVTNDDYARFVADTGHQAPDVDRETWDGYGLIHPYDRTRRHAWQDGVPPDGRGNHPVVLVNHADAMAYAVWYSAQTGQTWRLPSEPEWEKAARGPDGRYFPWGNDFDPARLNSHDGGPFDTMPVGQFPDGASPYGVLDMAGQVFEWTGTASGASRYLVKGGSWDDSGCGVCRSAARHGRPADLKHILIGFRLVSPDVE